MQFHYALVDDLMSREMFERRVEEKMQACGDLVDDITAAMLVVGDLGRHHVKIRGLAGKSSLFSFFGKVISKGPVREFLRQDGEPGLVTEMILGDETGQVRAVLWDEKAMVTEEIDTGDVLEVIGRHTGKNAADITVMALRKAICEIECGNSVDPHLAPPERKDVDIRLLFTGVPRVVTRKDGRTSEKVDGVAADCEGIIRLICWVPGLLKGTLPGSLLHVGGALLKNRIYGREYSIDDKSSVNPGNVVIEAQFTPIGEVGESGNYSIKGQIKHLQPIRNFTSREGKSSYVRNLTLTDGNSDIRVVLWGDHAKQQLLAGDQVEVFLVQAKIGRYGELELSVGASGFFHLVTSTGEEEIEIEGTIITTRSGTFIDNGNDRFLIHGDLPHGQEVRIKGVRKGERITPLSCEPLTLDPVNLITRLDQFIANTVGENTFTPHGREDI